MSNALKKEPKFSTADLNLSATLYALGFAPISIDKKNQRRMLFIFLDTYELMTAVNRYWSKQLKLEPQQLFGALKNLKSRLHEETL